MTDKFNRFHECVDGGNDDFDFAYRVEASSPWWPLRATNVGLNMIMDNVCYCVFYGMNMLLLEYETKVCSGIALLEIVSVGVVVIFPGPVRRLRTSIKTLRSLV